MIPGRAHRPCALLGGPRAPRLPPLPLLQTFSQLPDLLYSAPRSASLMNYSAARDPISTPGPPGRARAGGGPPSLPRAPPFSAWSRPAQSQPPPAQPRPPGPVPQSPSLPPGPLSGFHPPRRRGAHSAGRCEQRHSREGAREPETGPPPASWGGTPRLRRDPDFSHVSLCARPARPCKDSPASPRGGNSGPHLGAAARCPARPHGPALRLRPRVPRGRSASTRSGGVQNWGG